MFLFFFLVLFSNIICIDQIPVFIKYRICQQQYQSSVFLFWVIRMDKMLTIYEKNISIQKQIRLKIVYPVCFFFAAKAISMDAIEILTYTTFTSFYPHPIFILIVRIPFIANYLSIIPLQINSHSYQI